MTRDAAILMARREACKSGNPHCVLNLNQFNPLYVIRQWNSAFKDSRQVIYVAHPETVDQGG